MFTSNSFQIELYLPSTVLFKVFQSSRELWNLPSQAFMKTSSNGTIFRITGPLCGEFTSPGEFPAQRPVTQSFDVFFDLRLNNRLSKQTWDWWFETPPWSLWRHCNGYLVNFMSMVDIASTHFHKLGPRVCPTLHNIGTHDIIIDRQFN